MSEEWREHARCRGMNTSIFVPTIRRGMGAAKNYKEAKKICAMCVVRLHCLEFALTSGHNEFGVYGGRTPKERQVIIQRRKVKQA